MGNAKLTEQGLRFVADAFELFQTAAKAELPIQIARSFIYVALYEGRSLREYCDLTGVAQSTMSRHLLDLGQRNRQKQPGFGLVEQRPAHDDLRRNVYRLTTKGRDLKAKIEEMMSRPRSRLGMGWRKATGGRVSASLIIRFAVHVSLDRMAGIVSDIAAYGNVSPGASDREFSVEVFRSSKLAPLKRRLEVLERNGSLSWEALGNSD